jgi:putative endonuclease
MSAVSYWVYILASRKNGTLYVGVTNNLRVRHGQHRNGHGSEFVRKYLVHRLVHVEEFALPQDAIAREKQIKNWRRAWKIELIEKENPDWSDLSRLL